MRILLYDLVGPALILPYQTGFIYQNQAGGILCNQREMEGILMPVDLRLVNNDAIISITDKECLTMEEALRINEEWNKMLFPNIRVDMDKLNYSEEAWLNVIVNIESYSGEAILTWENSD